MRRCSRLALGALIWAALALPVAAGGAELVGSFVWRDSGDGFGGFSGFDLGPDGLGFAVVSDKSLLMTGQLQRDAAGRVTAVVVESRAWLMGPGKGRQASRAGDSEGLSFGPKQRLYLSFEGPARVERGSGVGGALQAFPSPRDFRGMAGNEGLEAMAVDKAGVVYALPERATLRGKAFAVFRLRKGVWDMPFALTAVGGFVPVGADFGPDGLLYVLQRDFLGIRGFATRVVRMDVAGDGAAVEVLVTPPGRHDNLEGIAVWRDAAGAIRLTMISDDNFHFLQQTEIVDYRLPD